MTGIFSFFLSFAGKLESLDCVARMDKDRRFGGAVMLFQGMFVELPDDKGVGKLDSVAADQCTVSIFYSVSRTETIQVAFEDIKRAYLSSQTRVYLQEDGRFAIGRITDFLRKEDGFITYEVRFPGRRSTDVDEVDLFVRPWNAPEDPAEILAAGGAESQYFHDCRHAATKSLLDLRRASQGLTTIISASVDIVPHQIAAVRRVLSDPVQRYLLADEVGLGKTIEAGLIVRQHLIDNSDSNVLITAPPQLCDQWQSELTDKLRLDQFGDTIEYCAHADLMQISTTPDILVVDEAHHLVGTEAGPLSQAADRLCNLARDAQVLLLISATPPLGDEIRFLALLNLLDPLTHRREDIETFREKSEQRRDIGRLLLSLNPATSSFVLRKRGEQLSELFPNDALVQDLAPRLIDAAAEGSEDVVNLCSALKGHIADKHRIHHRLIRSRRADAKGWEFIPRGPAGSDLTHVRCEVDPSDKIDPLLVTLEDWRFAALDAVVGDQVTLAQMALRYRDLLTVVELGTASLTRWRHVATETFEGEDEILQRLRAIVDDGSERARIDVMVESTRRLFRTLKAEISAPKIVVFASLAATASIFKSIYDEKYDGTVSYLLTEEEPGAGAEQIDSFRKGSNGAVLVVDRAGEEGLNLNFADAIVHLDFPLSVARIEQRIGRLDRFGRQQGIIRHRILLPSDEEASPWSAWFELLADGFLIFNRSISDIQFLLEDLEAKAFQTLLQRGMDGVVELSAEFRERIDEERRSQDEQYALDQIALAEEPVDDFIQSLETAEENEEKLECDIDGWLVGALGLKKDYPSFPEKALFRLSMTKRTRIPYWPWQFELGVDPKESLTWKRRIATRRGDVTLLRPGSPLIDGAEHFAAWDDQGTAFITYRTVSGWSDDPWVGFKLCFIMEPALDISDRLAPTIAERVASRRAQRYYPAQHHTLYVDVNGDTVSDGNLLAILNRPYNNRYKGVFPPDVNLGSRPQAFAEIIDPTAFAQICRGVRDQARRSLANRPEIVEQIEIGLRQANTDLERRRNRLRTSQSASDDLARADMALIETILPAIREPSIRLEAMGCFVIASHPLRRSDGG